MVALLLEGFAGSNAEHESRINPDVQLSSLVKMGHAGEIGKSP
jgi:hypothetical protein